MSIEEEKDNIDEGLRTISLSKHEYQSLLDRLTSIESDIQNIVESITLLLNK